jgi:hypothetical protein
VAFLDDFYKKEVSFFCRNEKSYTFAIPIDKGLAVIAR